MKIKSVILENFRGYRKRQTVEINDFTAFVGKNDVGKSTVLEALDIFFNEGSGIIPLQSDDINIESLRDSKDGNVDIIIGVEFVEVPTTVVLDDINSTSLKEEFLLSDRNTLIILKRYPNARNAPKVSVLANHPSHFECCDLLTKKQSELRKIAEKLECDRNKNAEMRAAIRNMHSSELNLKMQEVDLSKEDGKNIWDKLKAYLPIYSLFQSDRSNEDKDKEVQEPLKEAVKTIFTKQEIRDKCEEIYNAVLSELNDVSSRTLSKIKEMNPLLASTLHPQIPSSESLKWVDLFKNVSITGDQDVPINKRGSGVRRMVLLNFFRAEAERTQSEKKSTGIIYAIEEPETAQHVEHQELLIKSLIELTRHKGTQVIITTHSSYILKQLSFDWIRLIKDGHNGKEIEAVIPSTLPYPSINEIAFTHFGEATVEYHDELYGQIEFMNLLGEFKQGKKMHAYCKLNNEDKTTKYIQMTKTEIIRNKIHHPENRYNKPYTKEELEESILLMRSFIQSKAE